MNNICIEQEHYQTNFRIFDLSNIKGNTQSLKKLNLSIKKLESQSRKDQHIIIKSQNTISLIPPSKSSKKRQKINSLGIKIMNRIKQPNIFHSHKLQHSNKPHLLQAIKSYDYSNTKPHSNASTALNKITTTNNEQQEEIKQEQKDKVFDEPPSFKITSQLFRPKMVTDLWNYRQSTESKCISAKESEISLRVQESIIRLLANPKFQTQKYQMYLARQKQLGILVSIKQVSKTMMGQIYNQLSVYSRLDEYMKPLSGAHPNIMNIYQTNLKDNTFLLVKQPYTSLLTEYLVQNHEDSIKIKIMNDIESGVSCLSLWGVPLSQLKLEDIVECNEIFKIHNLNIKISNEIQTVKSIMVDFERELDELINKLKRDQAFE